LAIRLAPLAMATASAQEACPGVPISEYAKRAGVLL
jgi:hypothetical protein